MLDAWLDGIQGLLQVRELMFLSLGMAIGLVFGALPGWRCHRARLADAAHLWAGTVHRGGACRRRHGGGADGRSLTAILLNSPGAAPNAATCLDGYPLAQQGKAGYAIGAAATANSLGGLIGTVSVLAVLPVAQQLVLLFGPPEFFLLAILALVTVAASLTGKMLRGLLTGGIGLMIATIGYDGVTGTTRFTGGSEYLWDGVHLVPALIGLFAVAEMINLSVTGERLQGCARRKNHQHVERGDRHLSQLADRAARLHHRHHRGRHSGRGRHRRGVSVLWHDRAGIQDPESFGKGNIQGVIAPEAAINAKDGSALIPTIAFGIPSGAEMAVFLGILVLHGMQPGPLMLAQKKWKFTGWCGRSPAPVFSPHSSGCCWRARSG